MRHDGAAPQKASPGLASCAVCHGIFTASLLVAGGDRQMCLACERRLAADGEDVDGEIRAAQLAAAPTRAARPQPGVPPSLTIVARGAAGLRGAAAAAGDPALAMERPQSPTRSAMLPPPAPAAPAKKPEAVSSRERVARLAELDPKFSAPPTRGNAPAASAVGAEAPAPSRAPLVEFERPVSAHRAPSSGSRPQVAIAPAERAATAPAPARPTRTAAPTAAPPPVAANVAAATLVAEPPPDRADEVEDSEPQVAEPIQRRAGIGGFSEYTALRARLDDGEDTLVIRTRAAELASALSLHADALEHYRRCVLMAPTDPRLRVLYEKVRRAANDTFSDAPQSSQRRVSEEAAPFWIDLPDLLRYPLRGRGKVMLLTAGVLGAVAEILGAVNVFGLVVSVLVGGYWACALFTVTNATGAGKSEAPEPPDATSVVGTYLAPLMSIVACVVLAFAPLIAVVVASAATTFSGPLATTLTVVCFVWGAFTLPMTLMVRGMFQTWAEALNPLFVLGSIARILPDYLAAYTALALLWVAHAASVALLFAGCWFALGRPTVDAVLHFDGVRAISWSVFALLSWPLFVYAVLLQGHVLGRLYRQGLRRLAWFVPSSSQGGGNRPMSVTIAVAALAATALLCATASGAMRGIAMASASATATASVAGSPLRAGSRLTYAWERSDGGAGLTTYAFDAADGGNLRVTVAVRLANRADVSGPVEEVGVVDPVTGRYVSFGSAWGPGITVDGRRGEHVPFYGPADATVGGTFINDWIVRGTERWRGAWATWRVQTVDADRPSAELYYDTKSGVLVGRKQNGVGHTSTETLVFARDVAGITRCPPLEADYGTLPLDWMGEPVSAELPPAADNAKPK